MFFFHETKKLCPRILHRTHVTVLITALIYNNHHFSIHPSCTIGLVHPTNLYTKGNKTQKCKVAADANNNTNHQDNNHLYKEQTIYCLYDLLVKFNL